MRRGYQVLYEQGQLQKKKEHLLELLAHCELCPQRCGVNRMRGQKGYCRAGRNARVGSFSLHFGEEKELVGTRGSGTIFFSYCNMRCLYCQNAELSHYGQGRDVDAKTLASYMLALQRQGAHNINFVTPTHMIAQIVEALVFAVEGGLTLPLVYNCGGYERVDILCLLEGVFDIYMPDIKYGNNEIGEKFSCAPRYWDVVRETVKEMYRQVGNLEVREGVATKGILVRHLVLPKRIAHSFSILKFLYEEVSPATYVNIMDQYYPCHRAHELEVFSQRVGYDEYKEVVQYASQIGLKPR